MTEIKINCELAVNVRTKVHQDGSVEIWAAKTEPKPLNRETVIMFRDLQGRERRYRV